MQMKKSSKSLLARTLASVFAFGLLSLGASSVQAAPPTPMKVGQTVRTTLEEKATKDYAIPLGKGVYRFVWDAQRVDEQPSNIIGKLQLLKPNGSIIEPYFLTFNDIGVTGRIGKTYRVTKPFVARLRFRNDVGPLNMWFTVVPVAQTKRVPFGWGAEVTPARISSDNGVGGALEPYQTVFHSITLPPGKWSISLGLQLPDEQNSNLMGSIDQLDAQGFTVKYNLVRLNEIDNQARKETIVTILKPTPMLLRVTNNHRVGYTYDVTIEKAQ